MASKIYSTNTKEFLLVFLILLNILVAWRFIATYNDVSILKQHLLNQINRNTKTVILPDAECSTAIDQCRFSLVESIPENLTYASGSPHHISTYDAWSDLLNRANKSIDMAVFYWSLLSEDVKAGSSYPSAWQGEDIYQKIIEKGNNTNVTIRVAQNAPTKFSPQTEGYKLKELGLAEVRDVDIANLVGGVLHTKLWIVDDDSFYIGSANMDFRSLTQVKELGVLVHSCPCLAKDMKKIFEEYWVVGGKNEIPSSWSKSFSTPYNNNTPLNLTFNGTSSKVYLSSSPPPFTSSGRVDDSAAIVDTILTAEKTVDVAVMDYFPRTLYSKKQHFWPVIDSALRRVALESRVRVRVMASHWAHTRPDLINWLTSLEDISATFPHIDVQTKVFTVPAFTDEQKDIPFGRVNHNKYMVTDSVAYIGTSNWSEDYFINTGGIGLVVRETKGAGNDSLRAQLQAVFDRDWHSQYAKTPQQWKEAQMEAKVQKEEIEPKVEKEEIEPLHFGY